MTRCIVTGGAGFIGSNFVRLIVKKQVFDKVVVIDKLGFGGFLENLSDVLGKITFIKEDLCNFSSVLRIFEEFKPTHVFHFAAETHVDRSIIDPSSFIKSNILGTYSILEGAKKNSAERLIHVSTDEVYGSADSGEIFTEQSSLNPSSPYSASKASSDLLCLSYYKTFNLPVIITRSSNNFGPYQLPEKFIPVVITNLLEDKEIPIYGTGKNIRNWIYVDDNCEAILQCGLFGKIGQVYNISADNSNEIENVNLAKKICKILKKPESLIKFVQDRPGHDFCYRIDNSKIKNELNWRPKVDLDTGLQMTINWYLENENWWRKRKKELEEYYQQNYGGR